VSAEKPEEYRQKSCEERVDNELAGTLETLRALWASHCEGEETCEEYETNIYEYGLSFDYVGHGTFSDQEEGFFRYQLSWGGPSDEFRFYCDAESHCYKIEYWFLDWFDGAHRTMAGDDEAFMLELWSWFEEAGSVAAELEKARQE